MPERVGVVGDKLKVRSISKPVAATVSAPPLRDGDHLTGDEFLRRWDAMPDVKFAELIGGIVDMASPMSDTHGDFHARLGGWLFPYKAATPGCALRYAVTWRMSPDDITQPDISLRILWEYGGQSRVEGAYPVGAPELAVEISYTTYSKDAGEKLRLYERSGVLEYLVVRPGHREIIWRELVNGKYQVVGPGADGVFRSNVFPGLWLNPERIWADDSKAVIELIERGTSMPQHAAFVHKLAAAKC